MSYDDNNPEHRKEVEEYLTRPANKPIIALAIFVNCLLEIF